MYHLLFSDFSVLPKLPALFLREYSPKARSTSCLVAVLKSCCCSREVWSLCSVSCGSGRQTRSRMILVEAEGWRLHQIKIKTKCVHFLTYIFSEQGKTLKVIDPSFNTRSLFFSKRAAAGSYFEPCHAVAPFSPVPFS